MADADLLALPLDELMKRARDIRDRAHGTRVTFSPKVFIPLTMLCRDKCGYCTFAQPPARLESPYLTADQVLGIARRGASAGCHEALFTLGERPEDRYPLAREWLSTNGYTSTIDYLVAMCRLVRDETGLLPHANAGALFTDELADLRAVSASQGMMIESLRADLDCHRGSPDKTPERRLATLEGAGQLAIPFTTGILVGIGETLAERVDTLLAIRDLHRVHGHVQEVIVQNFRAKPTIGRADAAEPDALDMARTIAVARLVLDDDVSVQAPPNLSPDDHALLLSAGLNDWGGISPLTPDYVNPEAPWPHVQALATTCAASGYALRPRLPVYDRYLADPTWLDAGLLPAVLGARREMPVLTPTMETHPA